MEKKFLIMAARMYGVDHYSKLPTGLYDKLIEVDKLCRKTNGSLRSRQIIAIIVQNWSENTNTSCNCNKQI